MGTLLLGCAEKLSFLTWGLHNNPGGRTRSVVPECCGCNSIGLSGCGSILAEGHRVHCTRKAHIHHPQTELSQSYLDGNVHSEALWSNLRKTDRK